jgi:hypothetical protein
LEESLDHKYEVGLPINHSLHKKIGSMVINKDITLLKGTYTLEDS